MRSAEGTREPTPCKPATAEVAPIGPHLDRLERCCEATQRIAARELRPALEEVARRRQPDDVLVHRVEACAARLRGLQLIAGAVRAPEPLAETAVRVERAVAIYVQAAASLLAAAGAEDEQRVALVEDAVAFIGFADRLHQDALASVAVLRP